MCMIMDHNHNSNYNGSNTDAQATKNVQTHHSKLPIKKTTSGLPRPIQLHCNSELPLERRSENMWNSKRDVWAELCRLRQENLRLQKEAAAKEKEALDFREKVLSVTKENATLMEELSRVTLDNHKLKMRVIAVMEENDTLHNKMSRTIPPFRTYPWSESTCMSNGKNCSEFGIGKLSDGKPFCVKYQSALSNADWKEKKPILTESWEEVSQKLLMQMKQEMKELEDLGHKLALEAGATAIDEPLEDLADEHMSDSLFSSCNNDFSDDDSALRVMKSLKDQSTKIKQLLISQNVSLKQSIQKVGFPSQANVASTNSDGPNDYQGIEDEGHIAAELQNIMDNRLRFARPSDESFRAYFKQQLSGSSEWMQKKLASDAKELQLLWDQKKNEKFAKIEAENIRQANAPQNTGSHKPNSEPINDECQQGYLEIDRECPVCQAVISDASQQEYELHVLGHFDDVALVQQYEVI